MARGKARRSQARLFVAVDLPDEVRRTAAEWGRTIARSGDRLRLVRPENLHLTLAFLGDRPEGEIAPLAEAIRRAASEPVSGAPGGLTGLSLGAPLWLPRRRPRALALEVHDPEGRLARLRRNTVREIDRAIGLPAESRSWLPHLTVIRLGRGAVRPGPQLPVSPSVEFDPETVTLYRSELKPEGAEYEALERIDLVSDVRGVDRPPPGSAPTEP
jgi:RNA 2',3'-cyclic 3'-phosphodiesterase